jgi:hypothetical protein
VLTAAVSPDNASNKKVIWSSDNTNVATVADGSVTPVAAGTAVITAAAEDGSCSDTCQVTVYERRIVSPPQTTSITGEVLSETGDLIKPIDAKLTFESDGTCTITMQAGDAAMNIQPDGTADPSKDLSKLGFATQGNGAGVTISTDGTLRISNIIRGQEYILNTTYDLGNGQRIITGRVNIKLGYDSKTSLMCTLMDPYGEITDQNTGKPIAGADIKLYYADTERNRKAGKAADTLVQLPVIDGFKADSNKDPQMSDDSGAYGFIAFPQTDYYIVAEKNGYRKYTSPVIPVENELVKWNFAMTGMQPVIILDTTSYKMAPGNIYEIGVKLVGASGSSVKFYSSNSNIIKVKKGREKCVRMGRRLARRFGRS